MPFPIHLQNYLIMVLLEFACIYFEFVQYTFGITNKLNKIFIIFKKRECPQPLKTLK